MIPATRSAALVIALALSPLSRAGLLQNPETAPATRAASQVVQGFIPAGRLSISTPREFANDPRMLEVWNKGLKLYAAETGKSASAPAMSRIGRIIDPLLKNPEKIEFPIDFHFFVRPNVHEDLFVVFQYGSANESLFSPIFDEIKGTAGDSLKTSWNKTTFQLTGSVGSPDPSNRDYYFEGSSKGKSTFIYFRPGENDPGLPGALSTLISLVDHLEKGARTSPGVFSKFRGRGVEFAVDFKPLIQLASKKAPVNLQKIVQTVAGKNFGGLYMNSFVENNRTCTEGLIQIIPGEGILGSLLAPNPGKGKLEGWIPPNVEEVSIYNLTTSSFDKIEKELQSLMVPTHPRGWGENFAWLVEILADTSPFDLIKSHLTGEIVLASANSTVESALQGGESDPTVILLGARNATKDFDWLKANIGEFDTEVAPALEPVAQDEQGIFTLSMDGEPIFYIAAREPLIALATTDDPSLRLLREFLATSGKGGLPKLMSERAGNAKMLQSYSILSLSHLISDMAARVAMRELRGQTTPPEMISFIQIMGEVFTGEKGRVVGHVGVTPSGLSFYSSW